MPVKNYKASGIISFFNQNKVFLREHKYRSYDERKALISNFLRVAPMGCSYIISPDEVDVNSYSKTTLKEENESNDNSTERSRSINTAR